MPGERPLRQHQPTTSEAASTAERLCSGASISDSAEESLTHICPTPASSVPCSAQEPGRRRGGVGQTPGFVGGLVSPELGWSRLSGNSNTNSAVLESSTLDCQINSVLIASKRLLMKRLVTTYTVFTIYCVSQLKTTRLGKCGTSGGGFMSVWSCGLCP